MNPSAPVPPPGPASPPGTGPLAFHQLPVEPDDGLPQAFTCLIGDTPYDFGVYANLDVGADDPPGTLYDLAAPARISAPTPPPGYLVLRVMRPGPQGPQVEFLRKLVVEPELVHRSARLAIRLLEARLARGNLNGRGHYGSRIVIGVAQLWE
ncbi:hypothetical protein HEK616_43480 [Streptomyces nigrescens]|uniref:DUF3168 domain-containing protein n=1 Tax=Streptomyces nigrescens TaxID=1920 RepID=A0ABM7ZWW0_STRNI|nr:hypothetical protein [Streptomyces nigrescens]BDM70861.1 hypothetical protein HEK616_43480 [Streptomyces nigrescens]